MFGRKPDFAVDSLIRHAFNSFSGALLSRQIIRPGKNYRSLDGSTGKCPLPGLLRAEITIGVGKAGQKQYHPAIQCQELKRSTESGEKSQLVVYKGYIHTYSFLVFPAGSRYGISLRLINTSSPVEAQSLGSAISMGAAVLPVFPPFPGG
ncbi:MAG: hypothetical protein H6985_03840 [Pseudomonadales bacterium]|nr:hypothetical protein [Pseudomonadales bacterium]